MSKWQFKKLSFTNAADRGYWVIENTGETKKEVKTDNSLIRTLRSVLSVSVLKRFDCAQFVNSPSFYIPPVILVFEGTDDLHDDVIWLQVPESFSFFLALVLIGAVVI